VEACDRRAGQESTFIIKSTCRENQLSPTPANSNSASSTWLVRRAASPHIHLPSCGCDDDVECRLSRPMLSRLFSTSAYLNAACRMLEREISEGRFRGRCTAGRGMSIFFGVLLVMELVTQLEIPHDSAGLTG